MPFSPTMMQPLREMPPNTAVTSAVTSAGGVLPPSDQWNVTGGKPSRAGNSKRMRELTGYISAFIPDELASISVG